MRTVGVVILGVILGLLTGFLLDELGGRIMVAGHIHSLAFALVLGMLVPACGIVGALVAIPIYQRMRVGDEHQ